MTTLTYITDEQIIADAAQMLIETHLHWSGSQKEMPSRDLDNIHGRVIDAYLTASFTDAEWAAMDKIDRRCEMKFKGEIATALFEKAAQLADAKWQAAMLLLGIEQQ